MASGLYTQEEVGQPIYRDGITQLDRQTLVSFWMAIATSHFGKSQAKAARMRDPLHVYLHRAIATSIVPRTHSRDKVNTQDLFFLYCLLMGRTCDLATSLVDFYRTASHGQARGDLYGGAYVTAIACHLGLGLEDDPQLSGGIPSGALAVANARAMMIVRDFPGVGPRLRSPYVPVPLPAAADIPVFVEIRAGVSALLEMQAAAQHQQQAQQQQPEDIGGDGPDPPPQPQQQYPQHMYEDLTPAARRVARAFDRRMGRVERTQGWLVHCMQDIRQALHLPELPLPESPPPEDED